MYRFIIGTALALVFVAFVAACGGSDKKTVSIPGGNGEVSTSNKLPDNFPDDFPIYKGAKVTGSIRGTQDNQEGFFVNWETGDSVDDVTNFYKDKFASGPWKSSGTFNSNGTTIYTVENTASSKVASLTIGRQDNKTNIAVFLGDTSSTSSGGDNTTGSSNDSRPTATPQSNDSGSNGGSSTTLPPEAKLPTDFPTDRVPLPSGVRITSASSFGSGGQQTYFIEVYTKDSPEKLADALDAALTGKGWKLTFTGSSNGAYTATYSGSDETKNEAVIFATEDSDVSGYTKAGITVTVVKQ